MTQAEIELRDFVESWYDEFPNGNAKAMAARYTDNARLYLANLPGVRGSAAIGELLAAMGSTFNMEIEHEVTDVDVLTENLAVVTGSALAKSRLKSGGDEIRDASRFVMVMERRDGEWRSIYDISQPTPDVVFKD